MIKKRLLFLFIFASLIVCRPASEREVCEIEFKDKKAVSFCGGAAGYAIYPLSRRSSTEMDRQIWTNIILVECIRLYNEREKCNREKWNDPTIY